MSGFVRVWGPFPFLREREPVPIPSQAKHDGVFWVSSDDTRVPLRLTETVCRCGCGRNTMQQKIVDLFLALRILLDRPLIIHSGFRCPEWNQKVGGKPHSQHLYGKALDVQIPEGLTSDQVEKSMEQSGVTAIGKYATFCHMDQREGNFRWKG